MIRERIADDIYVFTSRQYAQVTAGAVLTREGAVLIDTLYFPEETKAIKEFLEERLGQVVRYVINTHYHADHTQGTCWFPHAQVIGHALCRQLLDEIGRFGLEEAKNETPELAAVEIVLPDVIFADGALTLHVGGKTLRLEHLPGHSPDLVGVLVTNDNVLFASDNAMPVPTIFDGSYKDMVRSLERMIVMKPDSVVQGHGEVILRGEVEAVLQSDMAYLRKIREVVEQVIAGGKPVESLQNVSIESCGKSRIPLNGLVSDLHQANLRRLYEELMQDRAEAVLYAGGGV